LFQQIIQLTSGITTIHANENPFTLVYTTMGHILHTKYADKTDC